ncbi:unnamed protein product [Rotaria sordida]|uniref:ubiquitinyl hydrolase 1 n=1 Tax=Rotaria sordida TaxID=392033 RepID=A0A814THI0_9BILA|nr:unnamed protein product [Rotaria sordida]
MTVLSTKKPSNTNRDPTPNQQQQQTSTTTRTRLSCDDDNNEQSNGINLNDDSNETNIISSSSSLTTTDNLHSMMTTTTSSLLFNNPKRKSYYNQKSRRKCTSIEENSLNENDQYNSEDEYEQTTMKYDRNNLNELEMHFAKTLKEKKGFIIKPVQEDGACLFRAISDQVFGDEEMHSIVRQNCMDYIVKNADFFRAYITEDFDQYITRKRRQNCHGNHIEMIALSELYNRPIEVYEYSIEPINIVHGMYKTDNEPIRLSYHCSVHYNSIIDPWRPTAGHGLGLPDLEPGRAQESLISTALRQSEESHIERTMLDDKLAATDWEATQDELIQQITRESYLQWLCDTNQQQNDNKTTLSSNLSSVTTSDEISNTNEINSSKDLLPLRLDERKDCEFALPFHYEDNTSSNLNDDDDSLIRQVLAMSQIEYIEK